MAVAEVGLMGGGGVMRDEVLSGDALSVVDAYRSSPFVLVELTYDGNDIGSVTCKIEMKNVPVEDEVIRHELVNVSTGDFARGAGTYMFVFWLEPRGTYDDQHYIVVRQEVVGCLQRAECEILF